MKTWNGAEVVELKLDKTAFGPNNPDSMDAEKYAVTDEKGNIIGWEEQFGEGLS